MDSPKFWDQSRLTEAVAAVGIAVDAVGIAVGVADASVADTSSPRRSLSILDNDSRFHVSASNPKVKDSHHSRSLDSRQYYDELVHSV